MTKYLNKNDLRVVQVVYLTDNYCGRFKVKISKIDDVGILGAYKRRNKLKGYFYNEIISMGLFLKPTKIRLATKQIL